MLQTLARLQQLTLLVRCGCGGHGRRLRHGSAFYSNWCGGDAARIAHTAASADSAAGTAALMGPAGDSTAARATGALRARLELLPHERGGGHFPLGARDCACGMRRGHSKCRGDDRRHGRSPRRERGFHGSCTPSSKVTGKTTAATGASAAPRAVGPSEANPNRISQIRERENPRIRGGPRQPRGIRPPLDRGPRQPRGIGPLIARHSAATLQTAQAARPERSSGAAGVAAAREAGGAAHSATARADCAAGAASATAQRATHRLT